MTVNYFQKEDKGNWYFKIYYTGSNWLFMEGIDLLINGNKVSFARSGALETEITDIGVKETMAVLIPDYVMQAISISKNLSMRINSQKGYWDKDFTQQDIQNFAYFYKEVKRRLNE